MKKRAHITEMPIRTGLILSHDLRVLQEPQPCRFFFNRPERMESTIKAAYCAEQNTVMDWQFWTSLTKEDPSDPQE